jgi:hypothetical protein
MAARVAARWTGRVVTWGVALYIAVAAIAVAGTLGIYAIQGAHANYGAMAFWIAVAATPVVVAATRARTKRRAGRSWTEAITAAALVIIPVGIVVALAGIFVSAAGG